MRLDLSKVARRFYKINCIVFQRITILTFPVSPCQLFAPSPSFPFAPLSRMDFVTSFLSFQPKMVVMDHRNSKDFVLFKELIPISHFFSDCCSLFVYLFFLQTPLQNGVHLSLCSQQVFLRLPSLQLSAAMYDNFSRQDRPRSL